MFRSRCLVTAHARQHGFTLVEIILVVVIVLSLAAVVTPRLTNRARNARINTTKISMNGVKTSLQEFETNVSRFPTTDEGLAALVTRPSDIAEDTWGDKYVDEIPKDSWGHEFKYVCPSQHDKDYDLISAGPDGKFDTNDDITNYAAKK